MLTTSHNLKDISTIALKFELQPPIYFLLAKIWRLIIDSVFWLRVLSILITCISIVYFEKLVRLLTSKYVLTITLLFALNPATIWVSLEIRGYGLMALMGIMLLYYFYKYYLIEDNIKLKHRILYATLAILGIWTNYYLVLLLAANFIVLLFIGNKKKTIGYFIDMIVPAMTTLLFIPFLSLQVDSYTNNDNKVKGIKNILLFIYTRYEQFLYTPRHFDLYLRYILRFVFLFLIAFKVKPLIQIKNKPVKYIYYHLLALTLILIVFVPFINKNMIKFRHTLFILPLLQIGFFYIISMHKRHLAVATLAGIGFLYLVNAHDIYLDTMNENGIITGAQYIEKKEQEGENIIIYRNELDLIFRNYYKGINKVEVMPFRITVDKTYNHKQWNIKSMKEIYDYFEIKDLSDPLWILTDTYDSIVFGVDYNYDLLNAYITKEYNTEFDTIFNDGIRLRKLSSQETIKNVADSLIQKEIKNTIQ
jgi:hypothetical protein